MGKHAKLNNKQEDKHQANNSVSDKLSGPAGASGHDLGKHVEFHVNWSSDGRSMLVSVEEIVRNVI